MSINKLQMIGHKLCFNTSDVTHNEKDIVAVSYLESRKGEENICVNISDTTESVRKIRSFVGLLVWAIIALVTYSLNFGDLASTLAIVLIYAPIALLMARINSLYIIGWIAFAIDFILFLLAINGVGVGSLGLAILVYLGLASTWWNLMIYYGLSAVSVAMSVLLAVAQKKNVHGNTPMETAFQILSPSGY